MVESNNQTNACLNLMRRLPPSSIEKSVAGLSALIENEELRDEIIQRIDQPLEVEQDTSANKEFLRCEYNRDGDSYRSPWSNQYFPESSDDATYPSSELLKFEQKANEVFQTYAMMYFDNDYITSVYCFDTDYEGFGAVFLIKKIIKGLHSTGI